MRQITKIVQEIGNGGHIYLPKELIGQKVIITLADKSLDDIKEEILQILKRYLEHISGVYLYGSYARDEQQPESDIDILVIGDVKLKKRINEYEITSASIEEIEKTLEHNAVLILPILKEAKPLLNESLIQKYRQKRLTKKNTRWYIETTESSLQLAEDWIKDKDSKSIPNIVYPLMMRLRGLCLIQSLAANVEYSSKQIDKHLSKSLPAQKITQLNRMYREVRDDKKISPSSLGYDDIIKLYDIVHNLYLKVRSLWEKLT